MITYPHKQYQIAPNLFAVFSKKDLTAKIVRSPEASGDIVIPRSIKHKFKQYVITRIEDEAFYQNTKIESLSFTSDSELESIGKEVFYESSLKHLSIPASLRHLDPDWCRSTRHLTEIEVASSHFAWVDGKFFLGKSKEDGDFDTLLLAGRKIEGTVTVPACVRFLGPRSFQWCDLIQAVIFETTRLQEIGYGAFNNCLALERVSNIPPLVKDTGYGCFCGDSKLSDISFLSDEVVVRQDCFSHCTSLAKLSFPNAMKITVDIHAFDEINTNFSIYIPQWTEVTGQGTDVIVSRIERTTVDEMTNRVASICSSVSAPAINNLMNHQTDLFQNGEGGSIPNFSSLIKRIRFLEDKLSKYEKVSTFEISQYKYQIMNESSNDADVNEGSDDYEACESSTSDHDSFINHNINIDEIEEQAFKVLDKICEDEISIVYKVQDTRTNSIAFKKIYKEAEDNQSKERVQNVVKRFTVLHAIQHPCIIKALAINQKEKLPPKNKSETHHSHKKNKKVHLTTCVYFEYLQFTLKECIQNHVLSNTLKARVAVEVGCGIAHLHHRGMILHDLCLDSIKLNGVFNAKIECLGITSSSKSKNNDDDAEDSKLDGTEEFMSPEIASKSDYDEKTDIYSYGIVLYCIFMEKLPKQSIQNKVEGKHIKLSDASDSISRFCLNLIEKCLSFHPSERPAMDEILNEMRDHSYDLASEVDNQLVLSRFRALNRFEALHQPAYQLDA